MLSDPAKYAIVASIIIAIMFVLFAKVTKKMIDMKRSTPIAARAAEPVQEAVNCDNPIVYPIYVDCSFELLRSKAAAGALPPSTP